MIGKLLTAGQDFERSLRTRLAAAILLLCLGLVGLLCYFLLVEGSDLPDFARGFYLGAASGITLGAVVLLVRVLVLYHSPAARKKARVQEGDEREKLILHTAFRWAGEVTFFGAALALFVVLPLSMPAFTALLGAMVLYCAAWAISIPILRKRL